MQKTKKLLAICLSCLTLISCISFMGCKGNTSTYGPTYKCVTCKDKGTIDCPNCHVKRCTWKYSNEYCYKGYIFKVCTNCNGKHIIGKEICSKCNGKGYDSFGYKCKTCNGNRLVEVKCPKCQYDGYYNTWNACSLCEGGYIGGKQCSDGSCSMPYGAGYTYIDCPDCEKY